MSALVDKYHPIDLSVRSGESKKPPMTVKEKEAAMLAMIRERDSPQKP